MTLATAGTDGAPSARVVLLRGLDERGFTWYTHRESLKGQDLTANPRAALVFHWEFLQRQVRVSGDVAVIPRDESAAYFAARPRKSRLSAWASQQGQVLPDRSALGSATTAMSERYPDEIPLPPFWGGYRLRPQAIEFSQGRRSRIHDRFLYRRDGDGWCIDRLAPWDDDDRRLQRAVAGIAIPFRALGLAPPTPRDDMRTPWTGGRSSLEIRTAGNWVRLLTRLQAPRAGR